MKRICLIVLFQIGSIYCFSQNNEYPNTGNVKIYNYSPKLILQRNTQTGGFIQGIQTKLFDGTDNWYFGAHQTHSWVVSKGNYQGILFTVRENGNVGIGTSNPNATMQIGDSNHSGAPSSEVEVKRLSLAPVTHSGSDWFFTTRDNKPYANLDIGYSSNKTLTLRHDGNVGIGTTNPDYKLDVLGTIRAQELKVDMQGADFVFEDDYQLRSIEEVENFVNENKHLPDVAPAAEMQENGVNQSEMNQKLLQKIEELTLYMIELSKEVKELKNENKELKNLINQ